MTKEEDGEYFGKIRTCDFKTENLDLEEITEQ